MVGIILESDEYVLSTLSRVQEGRNFAKKIYNLTLTNKRLIFNKIGTLNKEKFAFEVPISDVKVFNGAAQVKVTTMSGLLTQIDIYLSSSQLSYTMLGAANSEALNFANALNHAATGTDEDIYSLTGNDTGATAFMKVFLGETSAEAKKTINQKVAIKCTACGGSFEGIKGKTAKCPYCGTIYNA